ncbi:hypothetical protein HK099_008367 [Clydaea vesicula]|uniref:VASt domain-containing protein n=1 Tax=Clydaea vesicula TaxID=447962 RepID=A0AAD5XXS9_9FUNG|nr:hypothetical protein HK099_008367 [Clydaea vesicula]
MQFEEQNCNLNELTAEKNSFFYPALSGNYNISEESSTATNDSENAKINNNLEIENTSLEKNSNVPFEQISIIQNDSLNLDVNSKENLTNNADRLVESSPSERGNSRRKPSVNYNSILRLDSNINSTVSSTPTEVDLKTAIKALSNEDVTAPQENTKFADNKRNQDFHELFKELPKEELLVEDFACALQKDFLMQGRMVTIPLSDVVSIEKRYVASLIPNSIEFETNSTKAIKLSTFQREGSSFVGSQSDIDSEDSIILINDDRVQKYDSYEFDSIISNGVLDNNELLDNIIDLNLVDTEACNNYDVGKKKDFSSALLPSNLEIKTNPNKDDDSHVLSSPKSSGTESTLKAESLNSAASTKKSIEMLEETKIPKPLDNKSDLNLISKDDWFSSTIKKMVDGTNNIFSSEKKLDDLMAEQQIGDVLLPVGNAKDLDSVDLKSIKSNQKLKLALSKTSPLAPTTTETNISFSSTSLSSPAKVNNILSSILSASEATKITENLNYSKTSNSVTNNEISVVTAASNNSNVTFSLNSTNDINATSNVTNALSSNQLDILRPHAQRGLQDIVNTSENKGKIHSADGDNSTINRISQHILVQQLSISPDRKNFNIYNKPHQPKELMKNLNMYDDVDANDIKLKDSAANVDITKALSDKKTPIHEKKKKTFVECKCDISKMTLVVDKEISNTFLNIVAQNWRSKEDDILAESRDTIHSVKEGEFRTFQYIAALNNPMGPKSTRLSTKETLVNKFTDDGEIRHFCIKSSSQTPDVPSGTSFFTNSRVCVTEKGEGIVRFRVCCEVEFVKSSWIKMAIERAVPEGMKEYFGALISELENWKTYLKDELKNSSSHPLNSISNYQENQTIKNVVAETLVVENEAAPTVKSRVDIKHECKVDKNQIKAIIKDLFFENAREFNI